MKGYDNAKLTLSKVINTEYKLSALPYIYFLLDVILIKILGLKVISVIL